LQKSPRDLERDPSSLNKYLMGWLRLVGSSKLQVSFAKEPYRFRENSFVSRQISDGVASTSRLLKITGLFCKRALEISREVLHLSRDHSSDYHLEIILSDYYLSLTLSLIIIISYLVLLSRDVLHLSRENSLSWLSRERYLSLVILSRSSSLSRSHFLSFSLTIISREFSPIIISKEIWGGYD